MGSSTQKCYAFVQCCHDVTVAQRLIIKFLVREGVTFCAGNVYNLAKTHFPRFKWIYSIRLTVEVGKEFLTSLIDVVLEAPLRSRIFCKLMTLLTATDE